MDAETQAPANKAFDTFLCDFEAKYPKAAGVLEKDRESLLAFYNFPAEHWIHIRTTNLIESTFATILLRSSAGSPSDDSHQELRARNTALGLVFQLTLSAEKRGAKYAGSNACPR